MERSIHVALSPEGVAPGYDWRTACSVVIDVLRATSVMTTAGAAGCRSMRTCESTAEAHQWAGKSSGRPLLCGERQCKPIEGFDLGNSPAEYTPARVAGRDLILTTTNGTRAIAAAAASKRLLLASFLNLDATLTAIEQEHHLHLVCAGTNGEVSYEDVLLAGAMVDALIKRSDDFRINDPARIARDTWRALDLSPERADEGLTEALRQSYGGRNLIAAGYEDDVERCASIDQISGIVQRDHPAEPVFRYHAQA